MTTTAPTTDSVESGIGFLRFIPEGADYTLGYYRVRKERSEAGLASRPWSVHPKLLREDAAALYRVDPPLAANP